MLTFACAGTRRASRLTALAGAALALPLIAFASVQAAEAEGVQIDNCVGTWHGSDCAAIGVPLANPYIRTMPQPRDATERARAAEEDRRWVERCRPTIYRDRYGVPRYRYAQPGCEFGVGAN